MKTNCVRATCPYLSFGDGSSPAVFECIVCMDGSTKTVRYRYAKRRKIINWPVIQVSYILKSSSSTTPSSSILEAFQCKEHDHANKHKKTERICKISHIRGSLSQYMYIISHLHHLGNP